MAPNQLQLVIGVHGIPPVGRRCAIKQELPDVEFSVHVSLRNGPDFPLIETRALPPAYSQCGHEVKEADRRSNEANRPRPILHGHRESGRERCRLPRHSRWRGNGAREPGRLDRLQRHTRGLSQLLRRGCVRCSDRKLEKEGRQNEMSDHAHTAGGALDRCICVHAEQNAYITAARFGIRIDGATLYTTWSPCFNCLKEAVQAGITRIVYSTWYEAIYSTVIADQYRRLYSHLMEKDPTRFEALGGARPKVEKEGPPDPYVEEAESVPTVALEPPPAKNRRRRRPSG
jgi:deoxycytidylate deaminase